MATIDQVIQLISAEGGKILKREGGFTTIEFPTNSGRTQLLFVAHVSSDNLEFVQFASPICNVANVASSALLQEAGLFGFRQIGDSYFVSTTLLLNTIDKEELALILYGLLPNADRLEQKYTGGDKL